MRILLDVDGVLGDFVNHALGFIEAERNAGGPPLPKAKDIKVHSRMEHYLPTVEDVMLFHSVINRPDFALYMPIIEGAVEGVHMLRDAGNEIVFVTAPLKSSVTWVNDRSEWVETVLGLSSKDIIFTGRKECISGDILVDDYSYNISRWAKEWPDREALLFDQPWNVSFKVGTRVKGWSGLISHILSNKV